MPVRSVVGGVNMMADVPRTAGYSFFQIYKKGQGYYTRTGTAVGAAIFLAGLFQFVWENVDFDPSSLLGPWLKIGIPLVVTVVLGLGCYWVIGVNRRSCDFMIATEGEMKKVNWTTKKDIIASTKVVILVTAMTAMLLFLVDYMFMNFFSWIGVLRGGG